MSEKEEPRPWLPEETPAKDAPPAAAPHEPDAAAGATPSAPKQDTWSAPAHPGAPESVLPDDAPLEDRVIAALRTVFDPEIPVNIYDLGLIYEVKTTDEGAVHVQMTLTSPACPVAGTLPGEVELRVKAVEGVSDATIELVWDPPWDPSKLSPEARLALGMP